MGHGNHVVPFNTYLKILLTLLALTVLTVVVSWFHFGFLNTFIAMLIATVKAGLVLAYFMHLKYDEKLYLVIVLTGVFFLIILFGFSYLDIYSRIFQPSTL